MVKLIDLSINTDRRNGESIQATFIINGGDILPLRVDAKDRPTIYEKVVKVIDSYKLNLGEAASKLYELMTPVARIQKEIESSYYLSSNLTIENGTLKFGEFVLEEALTAHMLSLLDENNVPKNEKTWKSYVKFLDNLFQNVNEDIRNQLFKWIEYENKTGYGFGITEDGCIVGYKGCRGTILEPMSSFQGTAIVDGVEITGHIPNKIGSVISMPRSAVEFNPEVGCSTGLHVGTRNYAVGWAPVLLLVKVNPRDIVSVPYECESQKMRVCEYTVIQVTDASDEHERIIYGETEEVEETDLDDCECDICKLDLLDESLHELLNENLLSNANIEDLFELISNELPKGVGMLIAELSQNILDECTIHDIAELIETIIGKGTWSSLIEDELDIKEMCQGLPVEIIYDENKHTIGELVDFFTDSVKPGIIIKSDETYKHIKLERLESLMFECDLTETMNEETFSPERMNTGLDSVLKTLKERLINPNVKTDHSSQPIKDTDEFESAIEKLQSALNGDDYCDCEDWEDDGLDCCDGYDDCEDCEYCYGEENNEEEELVKFIELLKNVHRGISKENKDTDEFESVIDKLQSALDGNNYEDYDDEDCCDDLYCDCYCECEECCDDCDECEYDGDDCCNDDEDDKVEELIDFIEFIKDTFSKHNM